MATPTLSDNNWIKNPITITHINNHNNEYPIVALASRSFSRFPGSRNGVLASVNSHNFFHEKDQVGKTSRESRVSSSISRLKFSLYDGNSNSDKGDFRKVIRRMCLVDERSYSVLYTGLFGMSIWGGLKWQRECLVDERSWKGEYFREVFIPIIQ